MDNDRIIVTDGDGLALYSIKEACIYLGVKPTLL